MENAARATGMVSRLEAIAAEAPEDGLTLGELTARLGEQAFGVVLFVLAVPVCMPFLYGIPQIVSLPMLAICAQMALGREALWLPARFAARRLTKEDLVKGVRMVPRGIEISPRRALPCCQGRPHTASQG